MHDQEFISPSVLFAGAFFGGSIWADFNEKRWSINLSLTTFFVIFLGVFEFIVMAMICKFIVKKICLKRGDFVLEPVKKSEIHLIDGNIKVIIIVLVQIFSFVLIWRSLIKLTGASSLTQAIGVYNATNMPTYSGVALSLPKYIAFLEKFCYAAGIFFGYYLIKKIVFQRKFDLVLFFATLLGGINSLMSGSRGKTIYVLIALVVFTYFTFKQKNGWTRKNDFKLVIIALIIMILVISAFQYLTFFLGRNSYTDPFEYLSIYLGAEIKNLDTFIRYTSLPVKSNIWGQETFYSQITSLNNILSLNIPTYKLNLPFQSSNGYNLGNVYTTFYPWLYDFGYIGVFLLVGLMALITQSFYSFSKFLKAGFKKNIVILIYGYISSFVVLSFFSNKFYENFSASLFYYVLFWFLFIFAFRKEIKKVRQ